MKLDYDLIRNLLLTLEDKEDSSTLYLHELRDFMQKYSYTEKQILYHFDRLKEAYYIDGEYNKNSSGLWNFEIRAITWQGHQFLDTIRPEKVWQQTTAVSKELGIRTVAGLSQIATSILSQIISRHLGFEP